MLIRLLMLLNVFAASVACTTLANENEGFKPEVAPPTAFELVRSYYVADSHLPLEASVLAAEEHGNVTRQQVRFRGYDREWVTATIDLPAGVQRPPIVVLLHGITQSKAQWWSTGGPYSFPSSHRQVLVDSGIAVIALDARNHGDRIEEDDFENPYAYLEYGYFEAAKKMIAETVLDVVRAIDYLESRDDVDAAKLGVAGFSLGAHIAWIATAVDPRIDRSLIMAMPILANAEGQTQSFTDPSLYLAGLQERDIMLIAAKDDTFYSESQITDIYDHIPSPTKQLNWIDGGHDLPHSTAQFSESFFVGQF